MKLSSRVSGSSGRDKLITCSVMILLMTTICLIILWITMGSQLASARAIKSNQQVSVLATMRRQVVQTTMVRRLEVQVILMILMKRQVALVTQMRRQGALVIQMILMRRLEVQVTTMKRLVAQMMTKISTIKSIRIQLSKRIEIKKINRLIHKP